MANFHEIALFLIVTVISVAHGQPINSLTGFLRYGTFNKTVANAIKLNEAMMELERLDEKDISKMIAEYPRVKRMRLAEIYKRKYGIDLITDVTLKIRNPTLQKILASLLKPRGQFYAEELLNALNGNSIIVDAVVEIIGTMSNAEMAAAASWYNKMNNRHLLRDIKNDLKGPADMDFVLELGRRYQGPNMDAALVEDRARALHRATERWSSKDSVFYNILTTYSFNQTREIFIAYAEISGREIEAEIEERFADRQKTFVLGLVRCITNKNKYFAEKLYWSIRGVKQILGAQNFNHVDTCRRIITVRSDIDLTDIKDEYFRMYGRSIVDALKFYVKSSEVHALVALVKKSKSLEAADLGR